MNNDKLRLDDQWAVVTGSTRGIGKAIALELASAGAHVIVHGRDHDAAERTCRAVRELKRSAVAIVTDVGTAVGRTELVERAWGQAPVDVWVNNAGVDVLTGDAADWPFEEKLERLWRVDVESAIELSRRVGANLQQRGRGVILNIGWDQAETGMAGDSGEMFAAAKGAVMAFTRSLARSLAPAVRVNCIAPGWIRTAWGEGASEYWQQRAAGEALLARWGEPQDVAQAARFLASEAASFITGQVIHVNGGLAR
jgi:3-oxoacyl-[acyl-carrier protein] reductase